MKKWLIEYWKSASGKCLIEKWLDKLSNEQLKSVAKELLMLESYGNDLKLPHSRALGGGLFELRERRFGYRIYYIFRDNYVIILLTAGDKQTQENDIKTARDRMLKIREEK